jgi:serine O-acetyltransferase
LTAVVRSAFARDLMRWAGSNTAIGPGRALRLILVWPGVQTVLLLRTQLALEASGHLAAARLISMLNLRLTGAEFLVGCKVGPGLVTRHPQGIVIGSGSVIGENCTILHRVTLGERYGDGSDPIHAYPTVGNGVVIGVGAALLGGIRVGDGAVVGANAVVVHDVAAGDVVTGIPAKAASPKAG